MIALALLITALGCSPTADWCDEASATHRVEPDYPVLAAGFGMTAVCRVRYDIDDTGHPENLCVRCATGLESPVPERAQAIAARQFVQFTEVAVGQWVYAPEYFNRAGVRTHINFLLEDQTEALLPDPPDMGECLGPQTS